jgi:hypothetical protein
MPLNDSRQTLEWIVARSHFKWKEAKKKPPLDLELFIYNDTHTASLTLDFKPPGSSGNETD